LKNEGEAKRKTYVRYTRFLVRKFGRRGNSQKKEASPTSSTSFLQTKFWMKKVVKHKEKGRKEKQKEEVEKKKEETASKIGCESREKGKEK